MRWSKVPFVLFSVLSIACDPSGQGKSLSPCSGSMPCADGFVCIESFCRDRQTQNDLDARADSQSNVDGNLADSVVRDSIVVLPDGTISDGSVSDAEICASISLNVARVIPNVMLLIDQSGSMVREFPENSGVTRWNAVREALLSPTTGVVNALQNSVRFGFATYYGYTPQTETCPILSAVDPALQNFTNIEAGWPSAGPLHGTPTGAAVNAFVARYRADLAATGQPSILLLATDGEPFVCDDLNGTRGRAEAIAAISSAFANENIKTYILSVGSQTQAVLDHFQELANLGLGRAASATPPSPYWIANEPETLITAIRSIVESSISCSLELEGTIDPSMACTGTVSLDGTPLLCDDANGWRAVDSTHIELQGSACETFQRSGAQVRASFPCEAVIL